jgi:hypothetical protein
MLPYDALHLISDLLRNLFDVEDQDLVLADLQEVFHGVPAVVLVSK